MIGVLSTLRKDGFDYQTSSNPSMIALWWEPLSSFLSHNVCGPAAVLDDVGHLVGGDGAGGLFDDLTEITWLSKGACKRCKSKT